MLNIHIHQLIYNFYFILYCTTPVVIFTFILFTHSYIFLQRFCLRCISFSSYVCFHIFVTGAGIFFSLSLLVYILAILGSINRVAMGLMVANIICYFHILCALRRQPNHLKCTMRIAVDLFVCLFVLLNLPVCVISNCCRIAFVCFGGMSRRKLELHAGKWKSKQ